MAERDTSILGGARPFPETNWSLIRLCQDPAAAEFRAGLDNLFRKYWGPVYFYIRRHWARDIEEAKDLTQGFFTAFLEKDFLASVSADKGRFRSFVCAALRHWLSKQKRAANALKRRPKGGFLSLDEMRLENRNFDVPASEHPDADIEFNEDWKRAILDAVLAELRMRARRTDKEVLVDAFIAYDLEATEESRPTYKSMSERFGLTVSQIRNGLSWVRGQFMEILRAEIRDQVASEEDFRAEAAELFQI